MLQRIWRSWFVRLCLIVSSCIALGYFSNVITLRSCQRQTERWLQETLDSHPTDWPHRHFTTDPATYKWPWMVTVSYGWIVSPTGGAYGQRQYLCVFGLAFVVSDHAQTIL